MSSAMCKARVPNRWFHSDQFPGTTHHACPTPAWQDGLCFRHHPLFRKQVLERRKARHEAGLTKVNAELATVLHELENLGHAVGAGNPS